MRSVLIVSLVVCLSMVAGLANAAAPGQVSDATLASFGLGGMQQMTDAQGTEIRGMGFVAASGCVTACAGCTKSSLSTSAIGCSYASVSLCATAKTSTTTTGLFGIPLSSCCISSVATGSATACAR
jgi:hypothetical protein